MNNLSRRAVLVAAGCLLAPALHAESLAWGFSFPAIEGGVLNLAQFRGEVLLVVNTASFCGYTYQYEQLEKLHDTMKTRGLTVIGIPSQDFNQEADSDGKVKDFCDATFGVAFPMSGIRHVTGQAADPFYAWVRAQRGGWEPNWNFNKVLIGRDGRIRQTFRAPDEPMAPKLQNAIEDALAAKA